MGFSFLRCVARGALASLRLPPMVFTGEGGRVHRLWRDARHGTGPASCGRILRADPQNGAGGNEAETTTSVPSTCRPAIASRAVRIVRRDGAGEAASRSLASEIPLSIVYNGVAHAVMMIDARRRRGFRRRLLPHRGDRGGRRRDRGFGGRARRGGRGRRPRRPGPDSRRAPAGAVWRAGAPSSARRAAAFAGIVELSQAVRRYGPVTRPRPARRRTAVFAAFETLPAPPAAEPPDGAAHAAAFADRPVASSPCARTSAATMRWTSSSATSPAPARTRQRASWR